MLQNRWNKFYLILFSIFFLLISPKVKGDERKIVNPDNGNQYLLTDVMSWQEARVLAEKLGGYLVTINDEKENQWLINTFLHHDTDFVWIGINDYQEEGHFIWINNENVTYTNWASGEPNNNLLQGGEDYGVINGGKNPFNRTVGTWSDAPEKARLRGIIEFTIN